MKRMPWIFAIIVMLAIPLHSRADEDPEFTVAVLQTPNGFFADIMAVLDGGTLVRMQRFDEGWIDFEDNSPDWDYRSFLLYSSVGDFNASYAGNYTLEINYGQSDFSSYTFTLNEIEASWFPALVTLDPVPSVIEQDHEFTWSLGEGDSSEPWLKIAGYMIDEAGFDQGFGYAPEDEGFNDLSLIADFEGNTGAGSFEILYVSDADGLISNWTHTGGTDLFEDRRFSLAASEDAATFTVVPEPSTVLLLATGLLIAGYRRRRSR